MLPPDGSRDPDDAWVGPDVRPVIEPQPEQLVDPLEAIDPETGLRVHSLQPRRPFGESPLLVVDASTLSYKFIRGF